MSIKFGFENEYFIQNLSGEFVLCPKELPHDECGWLAEARGTPSFDAFEAAGSLIAKTQKLWLDLRKLNLNFASEITNNDSERITSSHKFDTDFVRLARRSFGKRAYPTGRNNIYSKDYKSTDKLARAGMHVHFSNNQTSYGARCTTCQYAKETPYFGMLDIYKIVRQLDLRFAKEIKSNLRLPGEYEIKPYGFEYRSLPNNVNVWDVAQTLSELKF